MKNIGNEIFAQKHRIKASKAKPAHVCGEGARERLAGGPAVIKQLWYLLLKDEHLKTS